jgi:hypothetical protein
MTDKINVIDRPPYKAWRVNFHKQSDSLRLVASVVIDAPDRDAAWKIVNENYAALRASHITLVERELRPPSEWDKS